MRTTNENNKKHFQHESKLWTGEQGLTKLHSDRLVLRNSFNWSFYCYKVKYSTSITLLNAKETKKVVDQQKSTLDQDKRQLDSADSIGKEMTHFKPIRLMPLSAIYM